MRGLIALLLFFSVPARGTFSSDPLDCIKKFSPPCAVLTQTKSEFHAPGFKLFSSSDALFQFESARTIYLARGILWVQTEQPMTIQGKFGSVQIRTPGDFWVEQSGDEMIVKALKDSTQVLPRGAREEIFLRQGYEIRMTYVDQKTRQAEFTVPMVLNLTKHFKVLGKVFPSQEMNFQDYTHYLGRVVLEAALANADWYQSVIQRKVSSAEEKAFRLKYEAEHAVERNTYLQKLFRTKNNFEDQ